MRRLVIAILTCAASGAMGGSPPKWKAPTEAQIRAALKAAKTQSRGAGSGEDARIKAAQGLLNEAAADRDPAVDFTLSREAARVLAEAGRVEQALGIAEQLGNWYEADRAELQDGVLSAARRQDRTPDRAKAIAQQCRHLVEAALDREDFAGAERLARTGESLASSAKDTGLKTEFATRATYARDLGAILREVPAQEERLGNQPDDPTANETIGRYLCYFKGDWKSGLQHLEKSSDAEVSELASKELKSPRAAEEILVLADGWWGVSQKSRGFARTAQQQHASELYRSVLEQLSSTERSRVERRLKLVVAAVPPARPQPAPSDSPKGLTVPFVDDPELHISHRLLKWCDRLVKGVENVVNPRTGQNVTITFSASLQLRDPQVGTTQWYQRLADVPPYPLVVTGISLGSADISGEAGFLEVPDSVMSLLEQLRTLEMVYWDQPCDRARLAGLLRKQPKLRELSFRFGSDISDADLTFFQDLKNLESLSLATTSPRVDGRFLTFLPANAPLKSLTLGGVRTRFPLSPRAFRGLEDRKELRRLHVWSPELTGAHLAHVARLERLQFLGLSLDDGTRLEPLRTLKNLEELHVRASTLEPPDLETVAGLRTLNSLRLWQCSLAPGAFRSLARATSLEALRISDVAWTPEEFSEIARLKNLKSLSLSHAGTRTRDGVQTILWNPTTITDEHLTGIGTLKTLETLHVSSPAITSDGLQAFGSLVRLRSLSLFTGGRLTSTDLRVLGQLLPDCKEIQIE